MFEIHKDKFALENRCMISRLSSESRAYNNKKDTVMNVFCWRFLGFIQQASTAAKANPTKFKLSKSTTDHRL